MTISSSQESDGTRIHHSMSVYVCCLVLDPRLALGSVSGACAGRYLVPQTTSVPFATVYIVYPFHDCNAS